MDNLFTYIVVGALGGFLRELLKGRGVIILPQRWEVNGKRGIDLGILTAVILGAASACFVDGHLSTAFWASVGAPQFLEGIIKAKKNGLNLKKEEVKNEN